MTTPSTEDRLNEALEDLYEALDMIERAQWKPPCPWCAALGHKRRCPAFLLLKKYGRTQDMVDK